MLNLDTHILIHALAGSVTKREKAILAEHAWGVSGIVLWEIAKLVELGRLSLNIHSIDFANAISSIQIWPIDLAVVRRLRDLDFSSAPADEIIAATSLVHSVPLITRDTVLKRSKVVPLA